MTYHIFEVFTKRDERTYKLPINTHSVENAILVLDDYRIDIIRVDIGFVARSMSNLLRIQGKPTLFSFAKALREITFYPKPDGQYKILIQYIEECKACHGKGYAYPA